MPRCGVSVVNGIARHLRARRGDARDQRRLAGVREAEQPHVGEHLQLEPQPALLPGLTGLDRERRLVGGSGEHRVAPPAAAALFGEPALAVLEQLGQHLAGVVVLHHRAERQADLDVVAPLAVLARARAVRAAPGAVELAVAGVEQRRELPVRHQRDGAAAAAVAPVGAAARHELLAAERAAPPSAIAAADEDAAFVDEIGRGHGRGMITGSG